MAITITLDVTIEGFGEKSDKGNFTARGVSFVLKSAKGCDVSQMYVLATGYGNNGQLLFMTKDAELAAKVNKSKAAAAPKAKAMTTDEALAMVLADPSAATKLLAMLNKK